MTGLHLTELGPVQLGGGVRPLYQVWQLVSSLAVDLVILSLDLMTDLLLLVTITDVVQIALKWDYNLKSGVRVTYVLMTTITAESRS